MVQRIGPMALHVRDLDRAVAFYADVLGLFERQRNGSRAYLACSERHHELILMERAETGYDHMSLEVPDQMALERAPAVLGAAGARLLGAIDDEPGIERALLFAGPGGHRFKLFCGMEDAGAPPPTEVCERPLFFEHVGIKVRSPGALERFLERLGMLCSDRMGRLASWYRCDEHHHGVGVTRGPANELHHLAWSWPDLGALGRIADRLRARGETLIWGPGRHGPGNNLFTYFFDPDGYMIECCADLALVGPNHDYVPGNWPSRPSTLSRWGSRPPLRFLQTGKPPVQTS